jgi:hypothetical protein
MTDTLNHSQLALREILYEFSIAREIPDAELLDEFTRRYPEYADALTEFAIEIVQESVNAARTAEPVADTTTVSPAVSRALSKFQNALYTRQSAGVASAEHRVAVQNPFAALDRPAFRALARDLNVNSAFLCKLRDQQINPKTMSEDFRRFVAKKMKIGLDVLTAFFAEGSPRLASQYFKANVKPAVGSQQSFEDAVRNSDLSEEQQEFLLGL